MTLDEFRDLKVGDIVYYANGNIRNLGGLIEAKVISKPSYGYRVDVEDSKGMNNLHFGLLFIHKWEGIQQALDNVKLAIEHKKKIIRDEEEELRKLFKIQMKLILGKEI